MALLLRLLRLRVSSRSSSLERQGEGERGRKRYEIIRTQVDGVGGKAGRFYEMVDAYDFADIVADEKDLQMQEQQILSDLKNGNAHFYVQAITDIINEQQDDEIIKTAVVLLNELAGF